MEKKDPLKLTKMGIILWVVAIVMVLAYTTYAFFAAEGVGTKKFTMNSGVLSITFPSESNVLTLSNALPTLDVTGSSGTPYSFTIKNTSGTPVNYNFKMTGVCCTALVDGACTDDALSTSILRYKLIDVDNDTNNITSDPSQNMLNTNKTLTAEHGSNDTDSYQLHVWVADSATNADLYTDGVLGNAKKYCAKIEVTGEQVH